MSCEHIGFEANVQIERITEVDGGPVVGYAADITIRCAMCQEPFCFRGLPLGVNQLSPTTSLDGATLRAPIHPMSDPTTGIGLLGFGVQVRGDEGS